MTAPSMDTLRWAARTVASGADVLDARLLGEPTGPWLVTFRGGPVPSLVLRAGEPGDVRSQHRFRTESTALELAERCGVPAPRLLAADLTGESSSQLAIVSSLVDGASTVPFVATPARLAELGRTAGSLALAIVNGHPELPTRMRPLSDVDFAAERAANGSTPLFDAAQAYLDDAAEPAGPHALVHGDLWQGNMMLRDDEVVGVVDWDAAGLGPLGVDLGSLRCDVAMYFGIEAVDAVHAGWIEATGGPLENLAHWDVVAASSTPVDLSSWMPVISGQGRPDVDLATVTARRNGFLKAALDGVVGR